MRFSRDRRGQSVVIGTVILFGFLILALSLYQVQIVPQQNAQVEFQHFEEVRNDLVELRAGILQAGSTDRPQYQTVRLGTSYSTRLFAINPPAPAGTIRTVEAPPITISNESDTPEGTVTIPTQFIQYRPGYNEIDQSPTWYDASVLYVDARDDGGIAVIEDQELVNDAGEVKIVALQNGFRQSGTGRVTVELRPAEGDIGSIPEGDLNVTVPTRLSGTEYWDETGIRSDVYGGVSPPNDDGIHNLTLQTTATNLTVDTVGIQEAPEDPTQNNGRTGGGGGGTGGSDGGDGGDSGGSPTFESVEATVTSEKTGTGNAGIGEIEFNWQLSESTEIRLRILDDSGSQVGSETLDSPSVDGIEPVSVTNGETSSGNQEPRPVTVEATIVSTGETCSATIGSGAGDGPFTLSCS